MSYLPEAAPPVTTTPVDNTTETPPPPIDKQLQEAEPEEARQIVDNLDDSQQRELQDRFGKLDSGQKQDFANDLAGKLDGEQLAKVRGVLESKGGAATIDAAVERSGNGTLQQDYRQAKVGLSDATVTALGLSPQDIKDVTKPVAEKLNGIAQSIREQDFEGAATQIAELKDAAAPLAREVLTGLVEKSSAPQAVKDFVSSNPDLVGKLLSAGADVLPDLVKGDFGAALSGLSSNTELRDSIVDALAKDPNVAGALGKLGDIAKDKLKGADPEIINAVLKGASGDWKGAAIDLAKAAAGGSDLAKTALSKAAQAIDGLPQPIKDIFKDPKLQDALAQAGGEAVDALLNGKPLEALKSLKDPALLDAVADVVLAQDGVKSKLDALKIDPASLKKAGDAIPDVLGAIDKLDSDPKGALALLASAATKAPELVADLAAKAGEKLTGDGATSQLLKSLVTDKQLMTTLLGNTDAHDAVQKILKGDVTGGLKALAGNDEANQAIAKHIVEAQDPATTALRNRLDKLGFKEQSDIDDIGPVLGEVIELGENLAKGKDVDIAAALKSLGEIGRGVPEGVRNNVVDKLLGPVAEHLPKISPEIKEVIKQVAIGVSDPEVIDTLVDGIKALPSDPGKFLSSTLSTVKSLTGNDDVQLAVLNALGKIGDGEPQDKGNIGAFFSDPDFNATLVETGAIDSFLSGVESIMKGDLLGGLKEFGSIMDKLLTDGDELKIGGQKVGWGWASFHLPSIGLHIGDKGLGNMAALMEHVKDALPKSARDKIDQSITDAASRVVGGTFPGLGDMKNIISDGKDLITEWDDNDTVDNVLNVAKLLSSIGGVIPGPIGTAADSLGSIVGLIEGAKGAVDTVKSGLDLTSALGVT